MSISGPIAWISGDLSQLICFGFAEESTLTSLANQCVRGSSKYPKVQDDESRVGKPSKRKRKVERREKTEKQDKERIDDNRRARKHMPFDRHQDSGSFCLEAKKHSVRTA